MSCTDAPGCDHIALSVGASGSRALASCTGWPSVDQVDLHHGNAGHINHVDSSPMALCLRAQLGLVTVKGVVEDGALALLGSRWAEAGINDTSWRLRSGLEGTL